MRFESILTRALAVVDRTLRTTFPDDYDQRCMYAAFGLRALLHRAGHEARIIGGDFAAFVVSRTGERAGLKGFGFADDGPAHYWVEAGDTLIDLGPHYLPKSSRYPTAPMPILAWAKSASLVHVVRYRSEVEYAPDVELDSTPEIMARMERFLEYCETRYRAQVGQPKLPTWLLSGTPALTTAASSGDAWAKNALRFLRETRPEDLPI